MLRSRSGGMSYRDNLEAAQNPKLYAATQELRYFGKEMLVIGGQAAIFRSLAKPIAGRILSSTVSPVKNGIAVNRSEKPEQRAA